MAKVLVIDDDAGLLQMVKLMLEREGHTAILAEGGEAGVQAALAQLPDVAIIDLMMPGISGYDVTRQLRSDTRTARMPILILTARSQPMDKQMAVNAGASAFMSKPVSSRELTSRIAEMLEGKTSVTSGMPAPAASPAAPASPIRRLPIGADTPNSGAPPTIPMHTPHLAPTASASSAPPLKLPDKPLPVIAVLAVRGGTGATTLTINTAFMLRRALERVCIVDMSMTGGHIGLYLHLQLRASWADLLPLGDKFDARAVGAAITPHPQQGIGVIGAPAMPPPRPLSAEAALTLFSTLSAGFQRIVVDVSSLNPASLAALAVARAVIVVIGDDMAAVQSAGNLAQTLGGMNIDLRNVRVVVNHSRPDTGVPVAAISKSIGAPVNLELPYDVNQLQALRRGVPTVVMAPESAFALALQQLARTL